MGQLGYKAMRLTENNSKLSRFLIRCEINHPGHEGFIDLLTVMRIHPDLLRRCAEVVNWNETEYVEHFAEIALRLIDYVNEQTKT